MHEVYPIPLLRVPGGVMRQQDNISYSPPLPSMQGLGAGLGIQLGASNWPQPRSNFASEGGAQAEESGAATSSAAAALRSNKQVWEGGLRTGRQR